MTIPTSITGIITAMVQNSRIVRSRRGRARSRNQSRSSRVGCFAAVRISIRASCPRPEVVLDLAGAVVQRLVQPLAGGRAELTL